MINTYSASLLREPKNAIVTFPLTLSNLEKLAVPSFVFPCLYVLSIVFWHFNLKMHQL